MQLFEAKSEWFDYGTVCVITKSFGRIRNAVSVRVKPGKQPTLKARLVAIQTLDSWWRKRIKRRIPVASNWYTSKYKRRFK